MRAGRLERSVERKSTPSECALASAPDRTIRRAGHAALELQRRYGNRYTQRTLAVARRKDDEGAIVPKTEQTIEQARSGGDALDSEVRAQMESAFGADFAEVRVHTDPEADALNRALEAYAFATGNDIFFRQGHYSPSTSRGLELLAHELTHVVQQSGLRLRTKLTVGAPGDSYEQEADRIASRVVASISSPAVQRMCSCGQSQDRDQDRECAECRRTPPTLLEAPKGPTYDAILSLPKVQRKCACGSARGSEDECVECRSEQDGVRHESGASLDEQDPTSTGVEPDVEFLYQNGTTTCTFPAGTPASAILNTSCSRPCTVRHEGVHAADIGPCCAKAGTAYAAAATPVAKSAVRSSFFGWMSGNRNWFECRGYAESVTCADEMMTAKHCVSPAAGDAACCAHLASYRASMEASRLANCGGPGLSPCPFP